MNYSQSWKHILWLTNTNYYPTSLTTLPVLLIDQILMLFLINSEIFFNVKNVLYNFKILVIIIFKNAY